MYTLIQRLPASQWVWVETPAFVASLLVAELFYKFHSFTLECFAFCVTWAAIGFVLSRVKQLIVRNSHQEASSAPRE